ncbi:histidine kinase [Vibrio parahaemolyticus]
MNQADMVYNLLSGVVADLNSSFGCSLALHQQKITKKHISVSGANGRLWVSPSIGGYDISVSGKSLEKELVPTLTSYFGRCADGYKQKTQIRVLCINLSGELVTSKMFRLYVKCT